jgi:hypothetical protein
MPDRGDPPRPRKDRLIQTRVARELETTLKREARRRRLTVSHLIRSILEDTFHLVDGVIADVDEIVGDSARLARNVRRNARRLVTPGPERAAPAEPAEPEFPDVYAWNEMVLNRAVRCARCGTDIGRGERGFFGLRDDAGAPRVCLCARCVAAL